MHPSVFILITLCLILIALRFMKSKHESTRTRYDRFPIPEVEKQPVELTRIETPLDMAVNELYPQFEGYAHEFERMSEDTFRSYCHSQISGGIGMKIRNRYEFWQMHGKKMDPSPLFEYLRDRCNAVHPDGMSDMIIKEIYRRYHRENPEAHKELAKFEQFKKTPQYRPAMPFDVRYPHEKATSSL